jgi:hypothetical protein
MRSKPCKTFLIAAAALMLLPAGLLASDHHDLNGTWNLIPGRSQLNGEPVVETGTITIRDHSGKIYFSQHLSYANPTESLSAGFTLEGRKNMVLQQSPTFSGTAGWENGSLLVSTTDDGRTSNERLTLQPDGVLMLNFEQPGHQPVTLFFERR